MRFASKLALLVSAGMLAGIGTSNAAAPGQGTSAVGALAVPAGQVNRYTIPHYYSVISGGGRSFTAVTVKNNSAGTCSAAVRFQKSHRHDGHLRDQPGDSGWSGPCVLLKAAGQFRRDRLCDGYELFPRP